MPLCVLYSMFFSQAAALPKGAKVEIEAIAALGDIVEENHNV